MERHNHRSPSSATLSVEEAAQLLGIGRSLAYDLARSGELPGVVRLGQKRLRVSRAALDNYLAVAPARPRP